MKAKIATYIVLSGLVVLSFFYYTSANGYPKASGMAQDAASFPKILAILLLVLTLISMLQTKLKNSEEKLKIPNFKIVLTTVLLTGLYFISWYKIGYFYIQTFLYLTLLNSLFRIPFHGVNKKSITIILTAALLITTLIYVVFNLIMPLPVKF